MKQEDAEYYLNELFAQNIVKLRELKQNGYSKPRILKEKILSETFIMRFYDIVEDIDETVYEYYKYYRENH